MTWILILIVLSTGSGSVQLPSILTPPSDVTMKLRDTAELRCEVKIIPKLEISWEFNDKIVYARQLGYEDYPRGMTKYKVEQDGGNFTLEVKDLHFSDGGKYTCRVLTQTGIANLIVIDAPQIFTPTQNPVEGSKVEYICTAQFGGPKKEDISPGQYPQLQMFFNGNLLNGIIEEQKPKEIGNCYNLTQIHELTVQASMDGNALTCTITTSSPEKQVNITIAVMVMYSVRQISYTPKEIQYEIGNVIDCSAKGNPEPQFWWENIKTGKSVHGKSLPITNEMIGSNTWRCTAMNAINDYPYQKNIQASFDARTAQQYSILTPPNDATEKVGGTAHFMCSVEFGNVKIMSWEFNTVTIYSYKYGQEEYPEGRIKYQVVQNGRNFTLKVNDLNFTDGGKYTCSVLSEAVEAQLIVTDTPQIYTSMHNPIQGSTANYICTAQFGGPKKEEIPPGNFPKLQMFFDGAPLNGKVEEQEVGDSGNCYNVTQIQNITLEAEMDGKPLSCEITTSSKEKHVKIMTEVMVLLHHESLETGNDAKKIAAGVIILVCIVFGCLPAIWCLYKRHRKQSSKTASYNLVETKSDCENGIGPQENTQGNTVSRSQKENLTKNEQMRGLITSTAEWIACKSDTMQEKGTLENSKPVCWDLDLINRLKLLLKEGADPAWSPKDSSDGSNLHVFLKVIKQVIFSKDHLIIDLLELLEKMMTESSVACSNIDRDGKTILHVLVDGPRKDEIPLCSEMLQKLILFVANRNPDLFNAKDNSGCTPLHIFVDSVLRGYQDTSELPSDPILFIHSVKTLASAANIDIQNEGKQTALYIFVELATDWVNNAEEFLKVVKLLKSSTNTSLRDWQGKTALQIFSKSGYTWQYCSEMFLSVFNELYNPAIINISHKDGGTVVDVFSSWAIDLAYHPKALLEIIDIFIFPGSQDAQDDSGDTMLHKYVSSSMGWKHYPEESLEIVKRLRSPTNIAIKNINGETPLHIIHHGSDGFRDCPATMSLKVVKCLKSDSKKMKYPAKKAKKVFRAAKGYVSHT